MIFSSTVGGGGHMFNNFYVGREPANMTTLRCFAKLKSNTCVALAYHSLLTS